MTEDARIMELENRVAALEERMSAKAEPPEPDENVERQRWFDQCGRAVTYFDEYHGRIQICSKGRDEYDIVSEGVLADAEAARVLVSRANAMWGVGRPEKLPEFLKTFDRWTDDDISDMDLAEAFDALEWREEKANEGD